MLKAPTGPAVSLEHYSKKPHEPSSPCTETFNSQPSEPLDSFGRIIWQSAPHLSGLADRNLSTGVPIVRTVVLVSTSTVRVPRVSQRRIAVAATVSTGIRVTATAIVVTAVAVTIVAPA